MNWSLHLGLVVILASSGMVPCDAVASTPPSTCPTIVVETGSGSSEDRRLVCDGAAKARAFFQSHGIDLKQPVRIRLHQAGIENHVAHIGLYDANKDQIDLLTFDQARRQTVRNSLFGMRMNESLYVSVVAHEVAHAIVEQNMAVRPASVIGQEYIAYVVQLATMESRTRSAILERYDLAAYADIEEMSSTFYALNPSGFGIKVFRHYQSLSDPGSFIRGLLSGDIQPAGSEADWW